jgi:hypothetical protein
VSFLLFFGGGWQLRFLLNGYVDRCGANPRIQGIGAAKVEAELN